MSLYEILSMSDAMEKRQARRDKKAPEVSDEEWAQAEAMIADVTRFDSKVRLH